MYTNKEFRARKISSAIEEQRMNGNANKSREEWIDVFKSGGITYPEKVFSNLRKGNVLVKKDKKYRLKFKRIPVKSYLVRNLT